VAVDLARFRGLGLRAVTRRVMAEDSVVRHDPDKLARYILALQAPGGSRARH
jgi:hypothetical protein